MKYLIVVITLSIAFFCGSYARAAESNFVFDGDPVVGHEWPVRFVLQSPTQKINTLGGALQFPDDILEVVDVNNSKSIINLWVQAPVVQKNTIPFAGMTPGGFQGENGEIFTVIFKVKKTGKGTFRILNPEAYPNDGQGTATVWQSRNLAFTAVETGQPAIIDRMDIVPPEPFTLSLGRNPDLYGNQWFVAFVTQDKGSGIAYYEVQESAKNTPEEGKWEKTVSPYMLKDQGLKSTVFARAVDKKGNIQLAVFVPSFVEQFNYQRYAFWSIIGVLLISVLFLWFRQRRQRP
jgi:hypothetical protein